MSAPWTSEEDDVLRQAVASRMTITRMMARLRRSAKAVRMRAQRLGLEMPA